MMHSSSTPRATVGTAHCTLKGMSSWLGPIIVTGTDTGVGKTMVTAAVAAAAAVSGLRVAMLKPAQTGDDDDAQEVARLTGVRVHTLARYPEPLAPLAAARVAKLPALELDAVVSTANVLAHTHDVVLIEGAGGLLVSLGEGWTIADVASKLGTPAVVVTRVGLGTLNHTTLTLEALDARGIEHRVVLGAWPAHPELVHHTNLQDLPGTLAGVLPDNASALRPNEFREQAPNWLTQTLHGVRDKIR